MPPELKFSYEIKVADLDAVIARNAQATLGSTFGPRYVLKACMQVLLWSLLTYVFVFGSTQVLPSIGMGILAGCLWLAIMPAQIRKHVVERSHKRLSDPSSEFLLGRRTLELDADRFGILGPDSELHVRWTALQKVVETPERLFLYVTGFTAHVVPLSQADRAMLVEALRLHAPKAFKPG